jgi:hypothetical protein
MTKEQKQKPRKEDEFTHHQMIRLAQLKSAFETAVNDLGTFSRHYVLAYRSGSDPEPMRVGIGISMQRIDMLIQQLSDICEETHKTWTLGPLKDVSGAPHAGLVVVNDIPPEFKKALKGEEGQ